MSKIRIQIQSESDVGLMAITNMIGRVMRDNNIVFLTEDVEGIDNIDQVIQEVDLIRNQVVVVITSSKTKG